MGSILLYPNLKAQMSSFVCRYKTFKKLFWQPDPVRIENLLTLLAYLEQGYQANGFYM
jgi:hypothetical protein